MGSKCWYGFLIIAATTYVVGTSSLPAFAQIFRPPVNAVPASELPAEFAYRPQTEPVDASQLRLPPTKGYYLDSGDVLGIFIDGVLGEVDQAPPVHFPPADSDLPPSLGFPVAVQADGSISLPFVNRIMVRGLTINQAEERIRQRFLDGAKPILTLDNRILVSLMRKRTVSVYVLRGDESASASRLAGRPNSTNRPVNNRSDSSQRAERLQLPAGDNDLLNALSRTGGLPGVNAQPDVQILSDPTRRAFFGSRESAFPRTGPASNGYRAPRRVTTVPTRQTNGFPRTISRSDIRLNQGDVVVVEPRDTEVFYTTGLLRAGEFPIPRDRGLDVVEAVSIAGGSLTSNGPRNQTATELLVIRRRPGGSQFTIAVDLNRAIANPAERIQVRPGDVLMLRNSPAEQIRNIGLQALRAAGLRQLIGR